MSLGRFEIFPRDPPTGRLGGGGGGGGGGVGPTLDFLRSPTGPLGEGGVLWTLDTFQKVKSTLQTRGNPVKITCKSLLKRTFRPLAGNLEGLLDGG